MVATAHPGDEEALVRSLGAAETVDYAGASTVDLLRERYPDGVAALIDLVDRGDDFAAMAGLVRDGGHVATTLGAADVDALAARGVTATNVRGRPTPEKLAWLADEVAAGRLQVVVQRTFPLAEVAPRSGLSGRYARQARRRDRGPGVGRHAGVMVAAARCQRPGPACRDAVIRPQ